MVKYLFSKKMIPVLVILGLFVITTAASQRYSDEVNLWVAGGGFGSVLVYIAITILAIVAAPLTSIPLIPLVVQSWGVFWTGIFSIIGWLIGSLIAFWIARKYGSPLVSKFSSIEKAKKIQRNIPKNNLFWYLIFLRMTTPVDILSYALGLFSDISWKMYFTTTLVGIIPLTFLVAYAGTLSLRYQLAYVLLAACIIAVGIVVNEKIIKRNANNPPE